MGYYISNSNSICTLWTLNDVTRQDPLERPQGFFTASEGTFYVKDAWKDPSEALRGLPKGFFTGMPLSVHSVCNLLNDGA